jgi:hypothetical protein
MKPSSASSNIDFELPVDNSFRSLPPLVPVEYMAKVSGELRALYPHTLLSDQERLERKVNTEFILLPA